MSKSVSFQPLMHFEIYGEGCLATFVYEKNTFISIINKNVLNFKAQLNFSSVPVLVNIATSHSLT